MQTDSCPTKKIQKLNNKQGTEKNTQQRGRSALSTLEKVGEARSWSLYKLSVNKAWRIRWLKSCCPGEGSWGSSPLELSINKACKSSQLTVDSR
jgi:hypothetical protein